MDNFGGHMTIEITYEARRRGFYEAKFTLEPEEEAKFLQLPEGDERDKYLNNLAAEHADYEDSWDSETEADVWSVEIDGEEPARV